MNDSLSSRLLRTITGSQVTRHLLRRFFNEGRMEEALDILAGKKKAQSLSCLMASSALRIITAIGSTAFGTSSELITDNLSHPVFRRAFSDVVSGLTEFGLTRPFVPGAPFQVVWNVTRTCNLKCQHCYENAGKKDKDELTTEEAIATIHKLANAGVVLLAFSGGEPTLRSDILQLIETASSLGMYVAIATNGLTFEDPERVLIFKNAGLSFVQISLDGCNPETHDSFRGVRGAFSRTLNGIKNCVEAGLFVEVAMTATHHNVEELDQTIDIADALGAKWFMVYNFIPAGRGLDIIDSDLSPGERERLLSTLWNKIANSDELRIEILSTAPQLGRFAREHSTSRNDGIFPTHFSNARLPEKMNDLARFIGGCGAGRFYLAIEPNGDIYPCVFFPHTPSVYLGNIKSCDFHKMWTRSKVLHELRNRELLKGSCGTCTNHDVCGGCRARAMGYFGDYLEADPGCIKNDRTWHNVIRTTKSELAQSFTICSLSMASPDPNWEVA